jgi:formylglycine-generating enzyme required for sulfatase activity
VRRAFRLSLPLVVALALVAFGGKRADLGEAPEFVDEDDSEPTAEDEGEVTTDFEDDVLALAQADGGRPKRHRGGCPPSMARVQEFCIDRYEAPNRRGEKPLVMRSANDAIAWCEEHRKRLCTEDEWTSACQGEDRRAYPYGATHVDGRCNDDQAWRAVDEAKLAKWPAPEAKAYAQELYQATPSGAKRQCASEAGVHDLTGNVEEWVVRTREHTNAVPYVLIGCYWAGCFGGGKPTCHSTNSAHAAGFRFYETGFRCCRDVAKKR